MRPESSTNRFVRRSDIQPSVLAIRSKTTNSVKLPFLKSRRELSLLGRAFALSSLTFAESLSGSFPGLLVSQLLVKFDLNIS